MRTRETRSTSGASSSPADSRLIAQSVVPARGRACSGRSSTAPRSEASARRSARCIPTRTPSGRGTSPSSCRGHAVAPGQPGRGGTVQRGTLPAAPRMAGRARLCRGDGVALLPDAPRLLIPVPRRIRCGGLRPTLTLSDGTPWRAGCGRRAERLRSAACDARSSSKRRICALPPLRSRCTHSLARSPAFTRGAPDRLPMACQADVSLHAFHGAPCVLQDGLHGRRLAMIGSIEASVYDLIPNCANE